MSGSPQDLWTVPPPEPSCGALTRDNGSCALYAGHNMGNADVPWMHRSEAELDAEMNMQIPGPLPEREDGYRTLDPEPWLRPWSGERAPHTGVNLYGSGYAFRPRPEYSQWFAWWSGVQAAINRWDKGRGTSMDCPYPVPPEVEQFHPTGGPDKVASEPT